MTTDDVRARLLAAIDEEDASLRALSLDIHAHPELAYEEVHAHEVLTNYLENRGFEVTRGAYGLPTAFRAIAGTGSPIVVVLCEYDALPGIGHACGHNLIAMAGVAAGLGVKAALEPGQGTIVVLGSPAEESGGGKVELIRKGAFEGVAAAMMLHPGGATGEPNVSRAGQVRAEYRTLAVDHFRVDFFGREAHAASAPWNGVNALDAAVHAYQAIGLLRQQIPQTARVHGIITKGGDAPNVIPAHSSMYYYVREADESRLTSLKARVLACFDAAASATGCRVEYVSDGAPYLDHRPNESLVVASVSTCRSRGLKWVRRFKAVPVPIWGM